MLVHKGLRNRSRLTQTAMRDADADTLAALQAGGTDQDIADEWGVSAGTVCNVRNKRHDMTRLNWLRLGERFGPAALDTVLSLIGARAVDRDAVTVDVSKVPCDVAKVLPLLIELFADGECSDDDTRLLDRAGAIDCLTSVADMLRNQRDALRTGGAVVSIPISKGEREHDHR